MPGSDRSSTRAQKQQPAAREILATHSTNAANPVEPGNSIYGDTQASRDIGETGPISKLIIEILSEGIYCIDRNGITTFVNPAAAHMTGWTTEELLGRTPHSIIHHSRADGNAYPQELCPVHKTLREGRLLHCDSEVFWRKDGSFFHVSYTCTPIFSGGVLSGAVVSFQDISERIRRERWQTAKNAVFQGITSHQPLENTLQLLADAYTEYHPGCSIALLLVSPGSDDKTMSLVASSGLSEALMRHLKIVTVEPQVSVCGEAASAGTELFAVSERIDALAYPYSETSRYGVDRCLALPMVSAASDTLGVAAFYSSVETVALAVPPEDALHIPISCSDRSPYRGVRDLAQIAIENCTLHSDLIHQAQHDHLTGLPNRLVLEDRLAQSFRAADRTNTRVAVCSIDIQRFRRVNESFGHLVGDELLQQITDRFVRAMRGIDTLARTGGDEFLVLLPELTSASDAELICRRLLLAITSPFLVQGHSLTISANIGISIYPEHAATPELLIQNADAAADFAKAKGQTRLQLYRPDLGEKVRQLAARETALRTALDRGELYLMYQPLFDSDRKIHGFEALLRWHSPELGQIPPDQFIPLAEATGLIVPIGEWVLLEACRQAMAWKAEALAHTKMFVNVSAMQLGQIDFTQTVSEALRVTRLSPSRLELEVTESLIVPSFKQATARLQPLQNLGVSIAIDDFGTGHSSFSILHQLPINAIKVDRSFVSRIDRDASGLSTVRAIVSLAQQLGMKTVGEGVETEAQFGLLNEMQCDYFQGYLLSRPLTPEAAQLLFEGADGHSSAA